MPSYIHDLPDWPGFVWDNGHLAAALAAARHLQGRLVGRMEALGFEVREETVLRTLTEDVLKSSEIEGEALDADQVRSSVARRLGIDVGGLQAADRHVEGVVEMMLDATQHYDQPLTDERLFGWHASLFPTGRSGMHRIVVGAWRAPCGTRRRTMRYGGSRCRWCRDRSVASACTSRLPPPDGSATR